MTVAGEIATSNNSDEPTGCGLTGDTVSVSEVGAAELAEAARAAPVAMTAAVTVNAAVATNAPMRRRAGCPTAYSLDDLWAATREEWRPTGADIGSCSGKRADLAAS